MAKKKAKNPVEVRKPEPHKVITPDPGKPEPLKFNKIKTVMTETILNVNGVPRLVRTAKRGR